jgi:hypothetical protein
VPARQTSAAGRAFRLGFAVAGLALAGSVCRTWAEEAETRASPEQAAAREQPIRSSIERVVERFIKEKGVPCPISDEAIPCFPVEVEAEAPRPAGSVADSLRDLGPATAPTPGRPPTLEEMALLRPGPLSPVAGVSFDPGCAARSAVRALKGLNDTYYLYRVSDGAGERIALYDHELDPTRSPGHRLELLGRYEGECEAVAAYRRAERDNHQPSRAKP